MRRHVSVREDGGVSSSASAASNCRSEAKCPSSMRSSRVSWRFWPPLFPQITPKTFTCVGACVVYTAASLATVFLNRRLLSDLFPFPLTLSWLQEVVGVAAYLLLSAVGRASRSATETRPEAPASSRCLARQPSLFLRRTLTSSLRSPAAASLSTFFPPTSADARTLYRVLPLSLAFVCMVGFSNTCLKHVQVSTYQVARSLTLLFNMVLQRLILDIRVSLEAALSCGVVCLGFLVGSLDASTLSLAGAFTGAVSSLFQAVYTVHIRKTLDNLGGAHAAVMFYNMVNAAFLFPPLIWVTGECADLTRFFFSEAENKHALPSLAALNSASESSLSPARSDVAGSLEALVAHGHRGFFQSPFWIFLLIVASGVAALFLTLSSFWIVGLTSPLTFNILGYVKACVQTCLGFIVLREKASPQALAGVLLTLSGSAAFSAFKRKDAERAKEQPQADLRSDPATGKMSGKVADR
ncbi:putative GDP-fucose transporter [Toxoplasma gondii TgCatPRC2]|uniref:Sugar phosphate transporter domain-containing protein n=3 Tax=Toxoplasma gondii TaxID=5811 RepID=S8F229_TOXGM|nr:hypothetical protein TGME49_267730 [Toxoplasma gondii ME49]EPT27548.1 hypothetical protein TGME49_267730 [Toxoplasma gondii ME49]KYF45635.1 putative GDP-fucose transporter [Toxoplasma gondii ARI]KYK64864.1 putative GDP-fucose transporter [Toxoplasma gondii TgCatPRC2]|eukprot:XP_002368841.1 hypothetical protein TGME49_267730 [Toxoplasma gondii ME49]